MKSRWHFSLPLMSKELLDMSAQPRTYLVRVLYAAGLVLVGLAAWREYISLRVTNGWDVLGYGGKLMLAIVQFEHVGLQIILPVLCCSVFTVEKERNTLGLLFLTRLGPWTILLEKFCSRLWLAWSFLLISVPFLALCYSMGGITLDNLLAQVLSLLVASLAIVSGSILCSTYFRTTASALIGSYLLLYISRWVLQLGALYCFVNNLRFGPEEVMRSMFLRGGISVAGLTNSFPDDNLPLQLMAYICLQWLWFSLACVLLSRRYLVSRAFLPPVSREGGLMRWLDHFFERANRNRVTRGVLVPRVFDWDLDKKPVAWRELISPGIMGSPTGRWRVFLCLETAALTWLVVFTVVDHDALSRGIAFAVETLLWFGMILLTCIASSGVITGERNRKTLDVLLVLPISSREIILQKMVSISQIIWIWAIPIWTCLGFRLFLEPVAIKLLAHVSMLLIYPALVAWIGMWHSLTSKTSLVAGIRTIGDVFLRCFLPLIVIQTLYPYALFQSSAGFAEIATLASPVTLYVISESRHLDAMWTESGWLLIGINAALHGGMLYLIRWRCLRQPDQLLGRAHTNANWTGGWEEHTDELSGEGPVPFPAPVLLTTSTGSG